MTTRGASTGEQGAREIRLALRALRADDPATAFRWIDRACRLPRAAAEAELLRADVLARLGDREGAGAAARAAVAAAPLSSAAHAALLAFAEPGERAQAAGFLIERRTGASALRELLDVLRENGVAAAGTFGSLGEVIEGWVAWHGAAPPQLAIDERIVPLEADHAHPLADASRRHAAGFRVRRPRSAAQVSLLHDGRVLARRHLPGGSRPAHGAKAAPAADLTVIVPLFGDRAATRRCLVALAREIGAAPGTRALIVDDASPDPGIARDAARIARLPGFTLVTNARNLGFVGSINRALAAVRAGDVLLLNSDAFLPPRALERLARPPRDDPRIGIVTALSNDAGPTSFPRARERGVLPDRPGLSALDAAAWATNGSDVVDVPTATGFCLHLTRACLDATGPLVPAYREGYEEDADLCHRARERGFRTVCATGLFVGHEGSRSFGPARGALVARNALVLADRFPRDGAETGATIADDPLTAARSRIERALLADARFDHAVVSRAGTRGGAQDEIAAQRVRCLAERGGTVLRLDLADGRDGPELALRGPDGRAPQTLAFPLSDARAALAMLGEARVEVAVVDRLPAPLRDALAERGRPVDVLVSDGGLAAPDVAAWIGSLAAGSRLIAPCGDARTFVRRHAAWAIPLVRPAEEESQPRAPAPSPRPDAAILALRGDAEEWRLVRDVARAWRGRHPGRILLLVGVSLDDESLMATGNVHVTGPVGAGEIGVLCERLAIGRLHLPRARHLFGHPRVAAAYALGLPLADHTGAALREDDLRLTVGEPADLRLLSDWMAGS